MLNRDKLFKDLSQVTSSFVKDFAQGQELALALWSAMLGDPDYKQKIEQMRSSYQIPSWSGTLDTAISVPKECGDYTILSVDGSQIYPDRHQGFECSLINIGTVLIRYGSTSSVSLDSVPSVLFKDSLFESDMSPEAINCYRSEEELTVALAASEKVRHENPLLLFDGSLIMWHLEGKEKKSKHYFLSRSLELMNKLYDMKILHAGYISLPKSKELVNIIRRAGEMGMYMSLNAHLSSLDTIVDTGITHFFLAPHARTIVFKNQSALVDAYPQHIRPHFFYLNNGYEIVRIEIPAWIAEDNNLVDRIAILSLDQAIKGNGYPVCLSEAHEQAVVKNADRDFFYDLMYRLSYQYGYAYPMSQKSLKKKMNDI
ncbi:MAG: DNA double-strand break repair nuclease NurA [Candidatus Babeliaceae bacterium]|jgi:hypothetical protein